ncbi:MAG: hypothetical protein ABIW82_14655, partial [Dokdonella sp.]
MRRIVRGAGVICGLAVSVSALASVALQGFSIVSTGGPLGNPGTSTGQPPVVMPAPTTVPVSLRGNSAASTNTLPSIPEAVEYDRLIRAHSEVGALDTGLLGESVDYFTGQTDFVATDVSLPGNNALAVAVGRRYHVTNHAGGLLIGAFGDWDLDIPHVEGIVATSVGWTVAGTTVDARCTYFGAPPSASTTTGTVSTSVPASEYSTGFAAVIPGSGRHELLLRAAATGAPIGPHPVTTKELWAVSCIQRGDVAPQPGAPDEGFVVTTPNGITYTFNQGWVRPYAPLTRPADTTTPGVVATVAREQIWLLPTKVEDRFHNQVTYSYESEALIGVALKHIDSSDGRHITLTWNGGQVQSVYDGTRTWSYQYPYGQNRLTQVKLPDASTWNFDLEDLDTTQWTYTSPTCTSLPSPSLNAPVSGTIQHPSGALGMFTFNVTRHGRSGAPTTCLSNSAHVNFAPTEPAVYDVLSLTEKKITGPNLGGALTWELAYDGCSSNSCNTTQTTTLTDARNYKTLYTFGSAYGTNGTGNEGMLLRKQTGGSGSTYTEDENYTYYDASGEPYPSVLGTPAQVRGDVSQLASLRPLQSRTLTLEGATYTQTLSDPDEYGFSKTITRAGTDTKTDTLVYAHDTTHWVLGTVKSLTSGSKTEFDLTLNSLNQPKEVRRFGRLDRSIDYYTDGAVHWIRDGASQQTTFRNFSLGIPKNIDYADNSGESVAVNALGQITSHNDPMGHITGFAYDLMGRLKKITPPAGYNPTTITWYPSSSGWSRNTTTGSASTDDTYDAFLHSVKTSDSAGRTVNRTFDADGRVTFESYPNDLISGITSTFDELGRLSSRTDGLGYATITTYDSTNGYPTIAVGDRNGHYTTTTFTTYDEPSAALPKFIAPPAGVGAGTAIQRDLWGKPTHIKRASISRDLTYYGDTQQLWKITEPETGTTTLTYDDAGNVQTVDHASAATETRTYDTRNRLKGITYSDASPSVGLTWRDDNQPDTATRGSTKRTYIYNTANLLTGESIAIDGTSYAIGYDYDLNRHLKTLTYPDTSSVAYAPDDFGRPSKVGSYATGVTYHPNGAIKAFNYGNGIAHSLTLDDRDLPWVATDTGILKVTHGYDHNGNPTNISGTQSRTLTYDTQDRLLTAAGPWGSSTLTCDDQDNLTGDTATALSLTIDPTSNLPTGGGLNWDSRGRLTHKGSGATAVNLTFNAADLLTGVTSASAIWTYGYDALGYRSTASSAGTTTTDVYDQGGRLLYETAVTSAVADRIFQNGFDPAVAATTATK